ncbi:MAG: glycerol dehydrogenase [Eubacteriales bacterium]|nr:glycerol dehydrogenase [Eubacteriales bacterium]
MSYVPAPAVRAWGSPGRYIQGPDVIRQLETYTSVYGKRVAAVIDQFFFESMTRMLKEDFVKTDSKIETIIYNSEVTEQRINAATDAFRAFAPEVIVGIGGGKTLDTAKAVADNFRVPVVIVPTSASTDAPTSALSVIYKENGEHSHARHYTKSPDLVLMDSKIIAKAPIRFLISGMGDALVTAMEARSNDAADAPNYINGNTGSYRRPKTALYVAQACYDTLMENGVQAKIAAENGLVTEALENIIEANTLMSGLGFENTGCAAAHSIGDGITGLPEGKLSLHGERCAFGAICQLVAEGGSTEQLEEVIQFCLAVGLPVTLEDLHVPATPENIQTIAEVSLHSFWDEEPFNISLEQIENVVLAGDAIGRYYKNNR